ncbi:tRNA (cmo5U34)-methyltransferase [Planctomycetes bacterium Pan216]|uniref:tRNA (Cmo5U34)-methyltransferase n=1 Tax=Kolteria novifilia TaxID=2527975 RepID=A0A518B9H9_9BACT|nr:tRNA (cmo5U34)-methyltransferase [Planctomycetes bacterium Pan216]
MNSDPASSSFSDPQAVARYAEGPPRTVPGFASLHRMTTLLLAERVPATGRVLVLGAGGGLELKAFATVHSGWSFDGVDPSSEMLGLAQRTLGPHAPRVRWRQGTIEAAPHGPFDGATCLLTLHFLSRAERRKTLAELHRRLAPGAPLVVAHLSMPSEEEGRSVWFSRYASFAVASGVESAKASTAGAAMRKHLTILSPEEDELALHEAGFSGVSLFYAGFAFRGWVAYA